MSTKEAERRATLPAGTLSLLAEMIAGGLDLVSVLELIEQNWHYESARASPLARGAASIDRILKGNTEDRRRGAWRELTDSVVRGDSFVERLYALFEMPDAMQTRLAAAERSGALGRVLPLLGGEGIANRERLVRDARIQHGFFDFTLKGVLGERAARVVFAKRADRIEALVLGAKNASLDHGRYWPGESAAIQAEWERVVRRARIVLRLGERARLDYPDAYAEAVYGLSDVERVRIRCNPISSLSTEEWSLDISYTEIDAGEEDRESDWLVYG